MTVLGKTMAAAALVGATALGAGVASAEEVTLTDEQQFAVDLVQEYNTCVQTGLNDPQYQADLEAFQEEYYAAMEKYWEAEAAYYEQQSAIVEKFKEDNKDVIDPILEKLSAAEEAYWNATTEDEMNAAIEAYEAVEAELAPLEKELGALIESQLGPYPEAPTEADLSVAAPADPQDTCFAEAEQTMTDKGTDLDTVNVSIDEVIGQYGWDTFDKLTAPTPAPAP